ncbi:transporter, small conductance mechanosensitive ion channel (MscS) family [Microscilla marina ATCC 23134]|uniref:Transporter, small conductance mechanosensitive ion channel (MscS) family n=1 Tax=Microscilla marina ATCC 23134 TaxID=313606 RepID=A1ZEF0_MICM2|nr:transporter, small conductance mechanosensitive ion channel (MscS) family [Microscilla marina ATCC 23134]
MEYLKLGITQNILFVVLTFLVATIIAKILNKLLNKYFENAMHLLKGDPTNYNFFKNAVTFSVYIIALIVIFRSIPQLRNIGNTLVASAGILAAIVGFASQQAFSNIIGGIFIVLFKPFRVGDFIKVGKENPGTVEDITLRHTIINSLENRRIVIPNSIISSATILNSSITDERVCNFVEVDIGYNANINEAIKIMTEQALKHPNCIDNRTKEEIAEGAPQILVRVITLNNYSVTLRAYVWSVNSGDGFAMKCDLLKQIKEAFSKHNIEIPYPYQNVLFRQNEN